MPHLLPVAALWLALSGFPEPVSFEPLAPGAPALGQDEPEWTQAELEASVRTVMAEIEELRGQEFLHEVPVAVSTAADFEAYMLAMEERLLPPDYADASEVMVKMLALLPADLDLDAATKKMLEGLVGGFYDPFSKRFYLSSILERGAELPILVHELVHALDDQLFDLGGELQRVLELRNQDRFVAYRAVVEGSAQNLANKWTLENLGRVDADLLEEIQDRALEGLRDVPAALWSPLVWSYFGGADFLVRATGGAGQLELAPTSDVVLAFREPPRSTEQVLHPEKYWDADRIDEPTPVRVEVGELPGWSVRLEDTVGELGWGLATQRAEERDRLVTNAFQLIAPKVTHAFSEGWDGDRAVLLENGEGDRVLYVATIWDTERDAGEFYAAMLGLESQFTDNLTLLAGGESDRRAGVGFELEYGETPRTVLVTLYHGLSRRAVHKVRQALTPHFE